MILHALLDLLFPPKCILCQSILHKNEVDICQKCRNSVEYFTKPDRNISFVAGWTALWYYKDNVRKSLLRYKFHNRRHYGAAYGRMLALKQMEKPLCEYDILSYVPLSRKRLRKRGFDQVAEIARTMGQELGTPVRLTLEKVRNTGVQSTLQDVSQRRANVLGAYRALDPAQIAGKRILLLDDIITTGATVSECARVLLTAGAKEVYCAAVAAPHHTKKHR